MWKRSRRSRQGHPRPLFLEALEERRLLSHGLGKGVAALLRTPPPAQTVIVNPAPAHGDQAGPDVSHHPHANGRQQASPAEAHGKDKPKPADSEQGDGQTGKPPGHAKGHDQDGGATPPGRAQTDRSDPDLQPAPHPQVDGEGPRPAQAGPGRAASPAALPPPGGEAARPADRPGPAGDSDDPTPVPPEAREADGAGTWVPQPQPAEGDADLRAPAGPNAQGTAQRAAVVNPGAAVQPRAGESGASLRVSAGAVLGPGQGGGGLLGAVAPEIAAALFDGARGLLEDLPDGTFPLSQGEDLVGEFLPFDPLALEAGLRGFLEQFEVAGQQLADLPPSAWLLAAAALVTAGELLRRRQAQAGRAAAEARRDALRWFPDMVPAEEDA
jgi:hypothetical protein